MFGSSFGKSQINFFVFQQDKSTMSVEQDNADHVQTSKDPNASESENKFNIEVDLISQAPDDSELIDAYERAVKLAKEKILQKRPELRLAEENCGANLENGDLKPKKLNRFNKPKKQRAKGDKKWNTGMNCRAVYSGDNEEYEAVICTLNPERDECVVKFSGYGNKEKVLISSLKSSQGPAAILEQKIKASAQAESTLTDLNESFYSPSSSTVNSHNFIPFDISQSERGFQAIPPIPPPTVLAGQPTDSTESLSSVLMAWYMAGYHTGFYEASLRTKDNKPYGRKV